MEKKKIKIKTRKWKLTSNQTKNWLSTFLVKKKRKSYTINNELEKSWKTFPSSFKILNIDFYAYTHLMWLGILPPTISFPFWNNLNH